MAPSTVSLGTKVQSSLSSSRNILYIQTHANSLGSHTHRLKHKKQRTHRLSSNLQAPHHHQESVYHAMLSVLTFTTRGSALTARQRWRHSWRRRPSHSPSSGFTDTTVLPTSLSSSSILLPLAASGKGHTPWAMVKSRCGGGCEGCAGPAFNLSESNFKTCFGRAFGDGVTASDSVVCAAT